MNCSKDVEFCSKK